MAFQLPRVPSQMSRTACKLTLVLLFILCTFLTIWLVHVINNLGSPRLLRADELANHCSPCDRQAKSSASGKDNISEQSNRADPFRSAYRTRSRRGPYYVMQYRDNWSEEEQSGESSVYHSGYDYDTNDVMRSHTTEHIPISNNPDNNLFYPNTMDENIEERHGHGSPYETAHDISPPEWEYGPPQSTPVIERLQPFRFLRSVTSFTRKLVRGGVSLVRLGLGLGLGLGDVLPPSTVEKKELWEQSGQWQDSTSGQNNFRFRSRNQFQTFGNTKFTSPQKENPRIALHNSSKQKSHLIEIISSVQDDNDNDNDHVNRLSARLDPSNEIADSSDRSPDNPFQRNKTRKYRTFHGCCTFDCMMICADEKRRPLCLHLLDECDKSVILVDENGNKIEEGMLYVVG